MSTQGARTLFQKIIDREIPAKIEYEDERYIVIHDVSPVAPVHVLVIPKVGVGEKVLGRVSEMGEGQKELVGGMFVVAAKVMAKLGVGDFRCVFNSGAGAQQTVFHLHLHVMGGRPFTWPPG